jgi:hypothetical protein
MSRTVIKIYAVLAAIVGLLSLLFFYPSATGCSDTPACALYSGCGLVVGGLGIWLFFLSNAARIAMIWFSALFVAYFVIEIVRILMTDHTGQGLVGILLLFPMFAVCGAALFLLPAGRRAPGGPSF